jgi:hypothetical protein
MLFQEALEIPLSAVEIRILHPLKTKIAMPVVLWISYNSTLLGI